ncbi:uncharacterized protein LOC143693607 isoform X2 [Agelaius phoeniceus]|uniref:uncharacterized protein LOC143693607 isoform X2 n=1 Tax=Agelaius phoeniceus TaxID=39638 RepID=UPI004054BB6A
MKEGRMCSGGRVSEERGNGGGRYGGGKPEGQAGEEEKKGGIRGSSTDGRRGSERRSGNFEEFGDGVALLIRRSLDQSHSGNPVLGKQAPSALFHMIPSEPSKRLPVVQEFLKTVMAMQCYKRFNSRTTSQKISEVCITIHFLVVVLVWPCSSSQKLNSTGKNTHTKDIFSAKLFQLTGNEAAHPQHKGKKTQTSEECTRVMTLQQTPNAIQKRSTESITLVRTNLLYLLELFSLYVKECKSQ